MSKALVDIVLLFLVNLVLKRQSPGPRGVARGLGTATMRHPRRKVGQWMNASILNAQSFSIICLLLLWGSARGEAPTSRSVRKRRLQRFEQQQLQQVYSAQPAPVSAYDEYLAEETLGQGVDGAVLLVPTELQGARYQALSKTHEYIQFLSFDDILPPSLGFSASPPPWHLDSFSRINFLLLFEVLILSMGHVMNNLSSTT